MSKPNSERTRISVALGYDEREILEDAVRKAVERFGEYDTRATRSAVIRRAIRALGSGMHGCKGGLCEAFSAYHGYRP